MAAALLAVFFAFVLTSVVVIALNPESRSNLPDVLRTFLKLLPATAFIAYILWFYSVGLQPYYDASDRLHEPYAYAFRHGNTISFLFWWFVNLVYPLVAFVVTIGFILIFLGIAIRYLVNAGAGLNQMISDVVRGWLYLIRQMFYFVTKPADTRRLKRSVTLAQKKQKAALEVAAVIQKERAQVIRSANRVRVISPRWWLSHLKIMSATYHYNKLAKYIQSLDRVGDATYTHTTESRKHRHDKEIQ
jgi:hypothetical protein